MKRFLNLLFAWTILLALPVGATSFVAPNINVKKEIIHGTKNVLAVVIGCNLEATCVIPLLNKMYESDPNNMYTTYLRLAELKKEQIQLGATTCKTEQVLALKKAMTDCLSSSIGPLDSIENILRGTSYAIKMKAEYCLAEKSKELAKSNNVYAQSILAKKSLDSGDDNTFQFWTTSLKNQEKTAEYALLDQCSSIMDTGLIITIETLQAAIKEFKK